jgi:hypothetical protein
MPSEFNSVTDAQPVEGHAGSQRHCVVAAVQHCERVWQNVTTFGTIRLALMWLGLFEKLKMVKTQRTCADCRCRCSRCA